ncbi:MAG TPA: class I SAM-dependent methyltransferase [Vicinamibacterales bacterium]|jgi:SAM-dependent methyltransferase|nr:class I SAM-dependent methyltransferase [Vicinamibacterales bacterium]
MTCCSGSPFQSTASQHFDRAKVAGELKRYRENGLGPTTRLLVDGIAESGTLGGSVIDVGAGIGSLALALLERGASSAVMVDASAAYVEAARGEAAGRGCADKIRVVHADFVAAASRIEAATVVTLDRVVCCYPSFEPLLDAAAARAERCLALSYPRDRWYVRAGMGLENGRRWLARNPFRTVVHPVAAIDALITRAGFRLASRRETWMWSVDVYVRR